MFFVVIVLGLSMERCVVGELQEGFMIDFNGSFRADK